jgi:autotransporter translocation and assembly factor TamB
VDLDLQVPGDVRVSQAGARMDVGEGNLHVSYRWPTWSASGSLRIRGGTYRLFNNNFTIQEGSLELLDTGTGTEVTVSIDGETFVATADTTSEGLPETVTIQVHVEGQLDELQVTLTSDPPYSPEEIAELLSFRRLTGEGRLQAETQGFLFTTVIERIESDLTEQFPLLGGVAIQPAPTGEGPMRLSVRPVLSSAVTVDYTRELYRDPAWEASLYYRLSRLLYLRAGVEHTRSGATGFDDEYSVDLRFRFEYE